MCRWGCTTTNTTYMCKWCGTRYCRDCLIGDFVGFMQEATHCRVCNQKKCQGNRVEYVYKPKEEEDMKTKLAKRAAAAASAKRSAAASAKSSRSGKSAKSGKSGKSAKSGKKSAKKKKKK